MDIDKVAQAIADDLFTNGQGEKARRLVLEFENGRNGGGWEKKPVIDRITDILKKHMDRDRRLAEQMGKCWHEEVKEISFDRSCKDPISVCSCGKSISDFAERDVHYRDINPNFSLPEWRAKLMDFCVGQEWWGHFSVWAYGTRILMMDKTDTGDFTSYLWRNLPQLVDEYRREK